MAYTTEQLFLLQVDLGLMRPTNEQRVYFGHLLDMAAAAIERKGVRLTRGVPEDDALVSMYAAWLYRKRAGAPDATAMPQMIRCEINDRLVAQTMGGGGDAL